MKYHKLRTCNDN